MDEKLKFQHQGLKWLYEMELVNSPQLINNLKLNIFSIDPSIKETEMVISTEHKAALVWLDLTWFGRVFKSKRIIPAVNERLHQLLPSYRVRVITDKKILNLSLAKLKGATNEVSGHTNDDGNAADHGSGQGLPEASDLLSDPEKQTEDQ